MLIHIILLGELLKTIKNVCYKDCIKTLSWTLEVLYLFCFVCIYLFYLVSFLLCSHDELFVQVTVWEIIFSKNKVKHTVLFILSSIQELNIFDFCCLMIGAMVDTIIALVCHFLFSHSCLLLTLTIPITKNEA